MDLRALIFMPALAGAVILGFVFLLYACHYYLTVLESTGAGAKDVTWLSESATDHFPKLVYLGWLVGLWLGPAYFVGRAATAGSASPWLSLAVPLAVFWLCYPVSQLSSLSASSMWVPLAPDVFARLAQKPGVVLGFLGLSAVTLAAFGVGFRWAFLTEGQWELLFVGAPLLVTAGLVYARLLGRLAFALRFTKGLFPPKKRKKPKPPPLPTSTSDEKAPPPRPAELPPVSTPDGELTGYAILSAEEPPRTAKKRVKAEVAEPEGATGAEAATGPTEPRPDRRPPPSSAVERARVWTDEDDEEATAYGVHEAEVQPEEAKATEVVKPSEEEVRLLKRDDGSKKPRRVWGPDLLAFLGQSGTVSAIIVASVLCFAAGTMIRVARAYNPVSGGE